MAHLAVHKCMLYARPQIVQCLVLVGSMQPPKGLHVGLQRASRIGGTFYKFKHRVSHGCDDHVVEKD